MEPDKNIGKSKKNPGWANLRPAKKGEPSRNPNGRPKKERCFADIARGMLESKEISLSLTLPNGTTNKIALKSDQTIYHAIVFGLIRQAMKGDVAASRELMDRVDGKPVTKVANVSETPFVVIMGGDEG